MSDYTAYNICVVKDTKFGNGNVELTLVPVYNTSRFKITVPLTAGTAMPELTIPYHKGQIIALDSNQNIVDAEYKSNNSAIYDIALVTRAEVFKDLNNRDVLNMSKKRIFEEQVKQIHLKGDFISGTIYVEKGDPGYDTERFDKVLVRADDMDNWEIIRNLTLEDKLSELYAKAPRVKIVPYQK